MSAFKLETFLKINEVNAASGLLYVESDLYLISDSSTYLYHYDLAAHQLHKIALTKSSQENIPKKDKPDFEMLAQVNNLLYLIGSGSTTKRNKQYAYNLKSKKITVLDRFCYYKKLKNLAALSDDELNLEGAFFNDNKWYLFQRGNSRNAKNGLFIIEKQKIKYMIFDLPKIKQIKTTFTDAVFVENKIYFLATAENTESTYLDGVILGSLIGRIDFATLSIDFTEKISDTQKFEGITLYKRVAGKLEFLLCEDNDAEEKQTTLYLLTISDKLC